MLYQIIADAVVLVHLLWIVFLVTGAFWDRKFPAVRNIHITGLGFSLISQVFGWVCPLTYLESWLRDHNNQGYSGSFIAHYAEQLVYLTVPRQVMFILTVALIGITLFIYAKRFRKREHYAN